MANINESLAKIFVPFMAPADPMPALSLQLTQSHHPVPAASATPAKPLLS